MKHNVIKLFCILLVLGCKQKNGMKERIVELQNGEFLKSTYINGTKLMQVQQLVKDNNGNYVPQGYFKSYYENGALKDSVFYVNGNKQGVEWSYFDDGKLNAVSYFNKGVLDSIGVAYYQNGKLAEWSYRSNGKLCGAQYKYYTTGIPINIAFYIAENTIAFYAHYDKNGRIDTMKGTPLHMVTKSRFAQVGELYTIANLVFKTRLINPSLDIKLLSLKDNSIIEHENVTKFQHIHNNDIYYFDYSFKNKGSYLYNVEIKLTDTLGNTLRQEIIKDTIFVK